MEKTPQEILKAYVDSQNFSTTTEIVSAMKEMFRDVLQQVMESELDSELGYKKIQRTSDSAVKKRGKLQEQILEKDRQNAVWSGRSKGASGPEWGSTNHKSSASTVGM